jgi:O-antigen ligase
VGALAIAAYQAGVLKMPRVSGFTNAIQYGGIAMYLGFATLSLALLGRWSKSKQLPWGCWVHAVFASFLSDSRGSWVVIPLLIAAIWLMAWLNGYKRLASMTAAAMLLLGLIVAVPAYQKLEQRSAEAAREVSQYLQDPRNMR